MKERPILFNAPMVRALLAGTKTQTRRIVKGNPGRVLWNPIIVNGYGGWCDEHGRAAPCPYGQPGDRLWVREAWTQESHPPREGEDVFYRADGEVTQEFEPWIPSIHMFRWASRITLEIIGVRVERLQDISEVDAIAEGVDWQKCLTYQTRGSMVAQHNANRIGMAAPYIAKIDYIGGYRKLWESINGPGSWGANPCVWVVEFKRVQP